VLSLLLTALPILAGCIENGGEVEDPFTEFSLLGENQTPDDYPENFVVGETQNVFFVVSNHENERVDYTIRIYISSDAWSQSHIDLSDIEVSRRYSPEMRLTLDDGEERSIHCGFKVPDVGAFEMRFKLLKDGEEYRSIKLWIKVFSAGMLKVSPDGIQIYTAGRDGDPGTMPGTIDHGGYFNFSMGIDSRDTINMDFNTTFRIGEVIIWSRIPENSVTNELLPAEFSDGLGYYLPTRMMDRSYLIMPLTFKLDDGGVQMVVEVESPEWSLIFTISIS